LRKIPTRACVPFSSRGSEQFPRRKKPPEIQLALGFRISPWVLDECIEIPRRVKKAKTARQAHFRVGQARAHYFLESAQRTEIFSQWQFGNRAGATFADCPRKAPANLSSWIFLDTRRRPRRRRTSRNHCEMTAEAYRHSS